MYLDQELYLDEALDWEEQLDDEESDLDYDSFRKRRRKKRRRRPLIRLKRRKKKGSPKRKKRLKPRIRIKRRKRKKRPIRIFRKKSNRRKRKPIIRLKRVKRRPKKRIRLKRPKILKRKRILKPIVNMSRKRRRIFGKRRKYGNPRRGFLGIGTGKRKARKRANQVPIAPAPTRRTTPITATSGNRGINGHVKIKPVPAYYDPKDLAAKPVPDIPMTKEEVNAHKNLNSAVRNELKTKEADLKVKELEEKVKQDETKNDKLKQEMQHASIGTGAMIVIGLIAAGAIYQHIKGKKATT